MVIPHVLQVGPLPAGAVTALRARFTLLQVDDPASGSGGSLPEVKGIATNGKMPIDAALLNRLPALKIISCLGSGVDAVDVAVARSRGVAVATTSHVLCADVADIAMGLVITLLRDLQGADRFVRGGGWAGGKYRLGRSLAGARLGIVGFGAIGEALAQRGRAFGMELGVHTRRADPASPIPHFTTPADLAAWCDVLALCCPGGPATHHLVDAAVLRALGQSGFLVNVSRGSVVDEAALADALQMREIAGAGLDVYEDEPHPNPDLLACPNVVLLPHIGSATGQTREAMTRAMVEALAAHF